jgi:hypothetical protein
MSSSRFPERDLRLERLGDRDGLRPAPYGEAAHAASFAPASREAQTTLEALIDAVFTAPGASEWLAGLRAAVAAMLARKGEHPRDRAMREAIRPATAADPHRGA